MIGLSAPSTPIYVSELLALRGKRLWYLARQFVAKRKYKYAWTKAGLVFIKKNDNKFATVSNIFRINPIDKVTTFYITCYRDITSHNRIIMTHPEFRHNEIRTKNVFHKR